MATLSVTRDQVLAHRLQVQDLRTPRRTSSDTAVLRVGVQDAGRSSALVGLAARTTADPRRLTTAPGEDGPLALALVARGAPHVVRWDDLPRLRAALTPLDPQARDDVATVAEAMTRVVGGEGDAFSRAELSEAVGARVPDRLRGWCEPCGSVHVDEALFRRGTLAAGLVLEPEATPSAFRGVALAAGPDVEVARLGLARDLLHLVGVIRNADLAAWLGATPGETRELWRALEPETEPVRVAGTSYRGATTSLDAIRAGADEDERLRLLPPRDPYLLGPRELLLPDRDHRARVWRPIQSPGVVLRGAQVVGTWTQRLTEGRLLLSVAGFEPFSAGDLRSLAGPAERVAVLRDAEDVEVRSAG